MKLNRDTIVGFIALVLSAVGLAMALFCTETWEKVIGLLIVAINVIVALDLMSDNL